MKQYVKMVIFIVALGAISAGLLIGVDLLTASKIEKNKMFELYGSILEANNVEFNQTNFDEVFNNNFDVLPALDSAVNPKPAYQHKETKNISYEFQGNGMWGPIKGVMTLKEDAVTIVAMRILEQEETPGLGARIIEEEFLNRFVDKKFPNINIIKDRLPTSDHEILGLTGATSTTGKLQGIINSEFLTFYRNYIGDDLDQGAELELYIKLLQQHGVELGDRNLQEVLDETFEIVTEDEKTLYVDNTNGLASFIIKEQIRFGLTITPEETTFIITLESDKETVRSIVGIYNKSDGDWGKKEFLDDLDAKGAKFPNVEVGRNVGLGGIFTTTGATSTVKDFSKAINKGYDNYKPILDQVTISGGDFRPYFEITEEDIENAILSTLGLAGRNFDDVMLTLVEGNLFVEIFTSKTVYVVRTKMHFGYDEDILEDIAVIVVFDTNKNITNVTALYESNIEHEAKLDLLSKAALDNLKGSTLPNIDLNIPGANYYPKASADLERAINQGYNRNEAEIKKIKYNLIEKLNYQLPVLRGQGYYPEELAYDKVDKLFTDEITVVQNGEDILYVNKNNNKVTIGFVDELNFGRTGTTKSEVTIFISLAQDFETVTGVSVTHDNAHWGKKYLLVDEVTNIIKGMKFPNIDVGFLKDNVTGPTVKYTLEDFNRSLNEGYDRNINGIKEQFDLVEKDGKAFVINKDTKVVTYYYETEISFGRGGNTKDKVLIYVTKEADFNKLIDITVIHDENRGHWGKRDLFIGSVLSKVKGRTIEELFKDLDGKYQFDDVTGVTFTTNDFRKVLLEQDASFEKAYEGGTK